jgi:predicted alpha/beta hydrolase family esterase
MSCRLPPTRLLIVPGLHDSGPAHWQTWLEALVRPSLRVTQRDWSDPHIERWSARIGSTLERAGPGPWIAAAHRFGALALVAHLAQRPDSPIVAALLVAPADPDKFGLGELLPHQPLAPWSTVVASDSDPWMPARQALRWARRWGSHCVSLGDAGHINTEAGFGPLPLARQWVLTMTQRLARERHAAASAQADAPAQASTMAPAHASAPGLPSSARVPLALPA